MDNIVICSICRNENRYLREWVEYHKNIGVDRIYLYDNDQDYDDNINDVIGDYIKSNYVIVGIMPLGREHLNIYNKFYNTYKNDFKWAIFIDVDEFIVANYNLHNYLNSNKFDDTSIILAHWIMANDNNLLYYNDKPQLSKFKPNFNEIGDNFIVKCILKNDIHENILFDWHMHTPSPLNGKYICKNTKGEVINNFINCYLRENPDLNFYVFHIRERTIHEFTSKRNMYVTPIHPGTLLKHKLLANNVKKFFLINDYDIIKENLAKKLSKVYRFDKYFFK